MPRKNVNSEKTPSSPRASAADAAAGVGSAAPFESNPFTGPDLIEKVLDSMPAGIAVVDRDGTIRRVNEAWRSLAGGLFGSDGANVDVGSNYLIACGALHNGTGRDAGEVSLGVKDVLEGTLPVFKHEYSRNSSGSRRWFLMIATPLGDEPGGAVISHRDVTDHRSAEEINQFKLRLNDAIHSLIDADEIAATYARMLAEQLRADRCVYAEIDADGDHFVISGEYTNGPVRSIVGRYAMSDFGAKLLRLMHAGEPYVVSDVDNDPRIADADLPAYRQTEVRAVVCLPLIKRGRFAAAIAIHQKTPRVWSPAEVDLIKSVVSRCWESLERARTEKKLRESEERLKLASDAMKAVVYDWDPKLDRITRSKELEDLLGFAPDEENSTNAWWLSRVHPEDREHSAQLIRTAFAAGAERFADEFRIMRSDGQYIWVLDSGIFVRNDAGEVIRCVGSVVEISGRKAAENALRQSERHSRAIRREIETLYRTAPVGMCQLDLDLRYIRINDRLAEICGQPAEDHIGKTVSEMMPELASTVEPFLKSVIASGEPVIDLEVEGAASAGTKRFWLASWYPQTDSGGTVIGLNMAANEITEKKAAEEEIRLSQERFRLAEEAGNVGIWDWDGVRDDTYWSDVMWRIYGLDRKTAPPNDAIWKQLLHPDDRQRVSKKLAGVIASSETDYSDRFRIERAPGDIRWIETIAKVKRGEDGRALRISGVNIDITDRLHAEGIRDRYRLLSEHAHDFIWFFRPDGQFVEVSQSTMAAYGYTREEFLSMNLSQVRHPSTLNDLPGHINAALQGNTQYETTHVRKDGSVLDIEVTANVTEFGGEQLILAINRDVTERRRADQQARFREQQLRLITDSVPALISYIDKSERYRFVNRTYTEWFGRPQEEFIGMSVKAVAGTKAYTAVKDHIDDALKGNPVNFEAELEFKSAGRRFVHVSYVPDVAEDGVVRGFYAMVSDVTSLKHSENLLRSSEERMDLIRENFTDYAILSTDTQGLVDSWNVGAENVFGYSEAEIMGRSAAIIFTPEDIDKGVPAEEMRSARRNGRAIDERWHIKKDGTRFFASGVMTPLYVGKALTGYAKIATDLTEKKRQAEELQHAHDQLELRVLDRTRELAESNNALMREMEERALAEKERVDLLRKLVTTQEDERRRIAREIHDQLGQRVTALRLKIASLQEVTTENAEVLSRVHRLQEIAERLDSDVSFLAWELRPTTLDDLGLVEAIRAFLDEWSRHYEIAAEFLSNSTVDRLSEEVETHVYRMTQEALNNIVKHAQATRVTVQLEKRGGDLLLIIEDDGVGFEPERQLEAAKSSGGLGLIGLRERAALFGGVIEIESSPGAGTTIFVRVPGVASGENSQYERKITNFDR